MTARPAAAPQMEAASPLLATGRAALGEDPDEDGPLLEVPLRALLRRADIRRGPLDLLLASALTGLLLPLALAGSGLDAALGGVPALVLAALLGSAAPAIALLLAGARRARRIDDRLADAIDLIVASLRSGFALQDALALCAQELSGPLARELAEVLARIRLGEAPPHALRAFADATGADGARLFARALAVKWEVGGELAETLSRIGHVLRERQRFARQVRTLTAQGRLSALVLLILPYAIALALYLLNPGHLAPLRDHPIGRRLAIAAVGLQIVGALWIARISRLSH